MNKDPKVFLAHIMESIGLIEEYSEGKTIQDFMRSKSLQDMIIRRMEIIGEAVKYLPDDIKDSHSEVPWKKIAGMRDILIHQYFGVDIEATWDVVEKDIPELKAKILKIQEELYGDIK